MRLIAQQNDIGEHIINNIKLICVIMCDINKPSLSAIADLEESEYHILVCFFHDTVMTRTHFPQLGMCEAIQPSTFSLLEIPDTVTNIRCHFNV